VVEVISPMSLDHFDSCTISDYVGRYYKRNPYIESECYKERGHRMFRITLQQELEESLSRKNHPTQEFWKFQDELGTEFIKKLAQNLKNNVKLLEETWRDIFIVILLHLDDWKLTHKLQGILILQIILHHLSTHPSLLNLPPPHHLDLDLLSVILESFQECSMMLGEDCVSFVKPYLEIWLQLLQIRQIHPLDFFPSFHIADFLMENLLRELSFGNHTLDWFQVGYHTVSILTGAELIPLIVVYL
jgi:hypothetical protein